MVKKRQSPVVWLAISLVLMLISALGASAVQTSAGSVTVKDLRWETSTGTQMSGLLFVPDGVSAENKAPAIVVSHGMYNNREMQDANFVELSRRGFVVLSMDMYSHGWSEPVSDIGVVTTGMYAAVKEISTLDYVDTDRIGITGHSLGGMSSNVAIQLDNAADTKLISAVFLNSADAVYRDAETKEYTDIYGSRAAGVMAGQYDEFFFADVDAEGNETARRDYIHNANAQSFLNFGAEQTGEPREAGVIYTEEIDGKTAKRAIYNPAIIHPWAHFSKQGTAATIEFFEDALGAPKPLAANDQVWQWKEAFNAVGLVGFGIFLVAMTLVLLRTPFFRTLAVDAPVRIRETDRAGKTWLWGTLVLGAVFAGGVYLPILMNVGAHSVSGAGWPQTSPYGIGLWAAAVGVFTLIVLTVFYAVYMRPRKISLAERGITMGWAKTGKTVLLALATVGIAFGLVFLVDYFFTVDFRLWVLAVKAFPASQIWVAVVPSLLLLLVFYVVASIAVNSINFVRIGKGEKEREWINTAILAGFNVLPAVVLLLIQYIGFFTTGFMPWPTANMPIVWLFPLLVILPVTTVISRKIYRATNNPYLPGIINGLVVTMIACSNTLTWA